jgi:glycosyltransferase involved in cell wall biosynthesis
VKIATLSNASVVHTRRWVEHLRGRGHEVRLWSLEPGPAELEARLLPRASLPGLMRYPLAVPLLSRELRDFAPDLVDAHYVPNYGVMGALSGVRPLSVAAWGSDLLVAGSRDVLQRARARWVMRQAGLLIADADNLAAAAIALGAPRDRVRCIPWGIDRSLFVPAAVREPGLLLSTRMHEEVYDIPAILRGAAQVMARRPETFLAIAGYGSLRPELEREAATLLPEGRYRFLGRLAPAELAGWLGRAQVYLSASLSDSTSLSLLEAMAAGALPVVSDIEGNREWVNEGDGARMFPCGDAGALAQALESALGDPAWAAGTRERNARVVAERGDWQVNFARIEACFEALVAGRPLPPVPARPLPDVPGRL